MSDEPDALLMRRFAESRRPLQDARFVAAVDARLPKYQLGRALGAALGAALGGILRPLRLPYAALLALGALGMAVWSMILVSSL
jgi:hypothetical protein